MFGAVVRRCGQILLGTNPPWFEYFLHSFDFSIGDNTAWPIFVPHITVGPHMHSQQAWIVLDTPETDGGEWVWW